MAANKKEAAVDELAIGLITDEGHTAALEALIDKGLVLRLYTNDRKPIANDKADRYTEIASKDYSSERLTPAKWTIKSGTPAIATYPEIEFTFDGFRGQVYGYVVTQGARLVAVTRFPSAPYPIVNRGDVIICAGPKLAFGKRREA